MLDVGVEWADGGEAAEAMVQKKARDRELAQALDASHELRKTAAQGADGAAAS